MFFEKKMKNFETNEKRPALADRFDEL